MCVFRPWESVSRFGILYEMSAPSDFNAETRITVDVMPSASKSPKIIMRSLFLMAFLIRCIAFCMLSILFGSWRC